MTLASWTLTAAMLLGAALAPPRLAGQGRWQLTLSDGSYEYELRPVALRGDSLVIEQAGRTRALALTDLHELREVLPVIRPAVPGRGTLAELAGSSDRIYVIGYLSLPERRRVVGEILKASEAAGTGHARGSSTRPGGTPTEWSGP